MYDEQTQAAIRGARADTFAPGQREPGRPLPPGPKPPRQPMARPNHRAWQLPDLIATVDPDAPRVDRQVWLLQLVRWLTGTRPARNAEGTAYAVLKLRQLLNLLERDPALQARVGSLLWRLWNEGESAALLTDLGFTARGGLAGALLSRLWRRWAPASPDTDNLATLFGLMVDLAGDTAWLAEIDDATLARVASLLQAPEGTAPRDWRAPLARALRWLVRAAGAAALAPAMRERMNAPANGEPPAFDQLESAAMHLLQALERGEDWVPRANYLRAVLDAARQAAAGVRDHLRDHGVSADLLYQVQAVQQRLDRMEAVLDLLVSPQPARDFATLLRTLAQAHRDGRSVRGLLAEHHGMLATKLAERHALTGERYVARDRAEYLDLLARAAGGGAVVAGTTLAKFGIVALGLAPLWSGLASGMSYAASFLLIYLLHWTLATKQPAMTAAALAARLSEVKGNRGRGARRAREAFVDETAALVRSQFASVLGNLGAVIPVMLALQALSWWLLGRPLISPRAADHVLESLTLLGPTALFAAFTGVILFVSSLVGGWVENAFVYQRLQSAIAHHPGLVERLGASRAQAWAQWWRRHVHGVASNLALGLMLGLLPPLAAFAGLPLDVRHVTLSTGQLAAAVSTLGWAVMLEPVFWWCVAGIGVIGLFNLGVSFALSLHMAIRARGISVRDRRALRRSLWRRARLAPGSFMWPPRSA